MAARVSYILIASNEHQIFTYYEASVKHHEVQCSLSSAARVEFSHFFMTFTPITPITSVEELFTAANVAEKDLSAVPDQNHSAVTDQPILAPVIDVLLHTSILETEELAKTLEVNARKLSGAIELLTGLPLGKFITQWRLLQSQDLLLNTDLPYSEVAQRCGYADESSLILIYKRYLKTTPHIFRTGYRIINSIYSINQDGRKELLNGENRQAKNKVYSKK